MAAASSPVALAARAAWGLALLSTAVLGLAGCRAPGAAGEGPVRIYAAASTTDALDEVLAAQDVPERAVAVVGASSAMARQIAHGAPADLFLSANPEWMRHLQDGGHIGDQTTVDLLANQLVVVVPKGSGAAVALDQPGALAAAIGDGRLAVGDPSHVPAGVYAQAALSWLGEWEALAPRLARTADVRAALVLVERGEVPAGIVYATDAAASAGVDVAAVVPAAAHPPITDPLAIVRTRGEAPGVQALYAHLQSEEAAAIFARHGFSRR